MIQFANINTTSQPPLTFIDVFSGCGGLSLGLMAAGLQGLFAVEKNSDAFLTLNHNLMGKKGDNFKFKWPSWLPAKNLTTADLLKNHLPQLELLQGKVDVLAGGPPCQGFSMAGRRDPNDPRNILAEEYIKIVALIKPRIVLLENVQGFDMVFSDKEKDLKDAVKSETKNRAYSQIVKEKLEAIGYCVFTSTLTCSDFGVPQRRKRFIMISIRNDDVALTLMENNDPFKLLRDMAIPFKKDRGLSLTEKTSVKAAISDLITSDRPTCSSIDSPITGYKQLDYIQANSDKDLTAYQRLLRKDALGISPNSLRLTKHKKSTIDKFELIRTTCKLGQSISEADRNRLGIKKNSITPLHPDLPSVTITTLPDDIIHYSESRILTVRENARLQSFPDWFDFLGKYTTGGNRRTKECPRYTQVGNAVPPLFAEALGLLVKKLLISEPSIEISRNSSEINQIEECLAAA
ncbi:MAG: DNA cytosine methyltransferase [Methylotenera sp.]|nr:DNA cytosine methyltransferase [Methylotenera sp.]